MTKDACMMKLPMASMPAVISDSIASVLKVHGLGLSAELLRELGRNATQALFALDESPVARYELGYSGVLELRGAARKHGAGEPELAAIGRLEEGEAEASDVQRLGPLAKLVGLPWHELFPDVVAGGSEPATSPSPRTAAVTPSTADLLAVGETPRALAAAGRPNPDTAEVLARVGAWLSEVARAELVRAGRAA